MRIFAGLTEQMRHGPTKNIEVIEPFRLDGWKICDSGELVHS
jgi:hypothetical protein